MDRLLTPEEAAERLAVSPKSIREWLRRGKLKGVRAGRLWRIREQDLEEFLERPAAGSSPVSTRNYSRREVREFLKADAIAPEIARRIERLLGR